MTDQQRTSEWFAQRLGKVTASKVADVIARTKSGYSASRENYLAQLVVERFTGQPTESYTNAAMQWGTDQEPFARAAYENATGVLVEECGLVLHPEISDSGASPDGLVGDDGLIEIKCPSTATMIETLLTGSSTPVCARPSPFSPITTVPDKSPSSSCRPKSRST